MRSGQLHTNSIALGLSSPAQRGRGTAQSAVEGARGKYASSRSCEVQHAPTTMLRMVPLPRFTGEDTQEPRISAQAVASTLMRAIDPAGAR